MCVYHMALTAYLDEKELIVFNILWRRLVRSRSNHSKPVKFGVILNNRSKLKIMNAVDLMRLDYFVYAEE